MRSKTFHTKSHIFESIGRYPVQSSNIWLTYALYRPLFCLTLFFFCHHDSVLTDEHAFNVPESSPWWDVWLGGATRGTVHALLGVSLMLVHDSKWVGQSWHQCTGLFLDASQHLPAGWLCLGVWVHTHTQKKGNDLTHTRTRSRDHAWWWEAMKWHSAAEWLQSIHQWVQWGVYIYIIQ